MKYVYVLTSTVKDLYYEQALMSVFSLKYHMPNAQIVLLTDNKTKDTFTEELKRTEIKKYCSEIISVDFDANTPNIDRSRLIKTSIPNYVKEDFLYIDCDTIICEDLSEIEKIPFTTAGVLDGHVLLSEHIHKKYFLKRDKKLGFSGTKQSGYNINGGLILAKAGKETEDLFFNWNEIWKYSAYKKNDKHDQSALNEANYKTGLKMQLLDGEWNCQPSHGGLAYLKNAKILHYYSSEFSSKNYIPYYKLADKKLQYKIKENGKLTEDIIEMIKDPKFQFNSVHLVNDTRIVQILQSPILFTFADINKNFPKLFSILENMTAFIRQTVKKICKK